MTKNRVAIIAFFVADERVITALGWWLMVYHSRHFEKFLDRNMPQNTDIQPIDAVITWVDGADPAHAAKLDAYLEIIGRKRSGSAGKARFHNAGEIDYCVTSILKFAPWVRTIFIVTDQQEPELVKKLVGTVFGQKIKVIDHRDIFAGYEEHLPTFNSSSILSMLWRIPGLSEQFIFFNDDFCLIQPVQPQDFFIDGNVVLRGKWQLFPEKKLHNILLGWLLKRFKKTKDFSFWEGQQLTARKVGFKRLYFRLPHVPHAWKQSTQARYFGENPDVLEQNIKHRLRAYEQLIGESLAAHLELLHDTAIINNRLFNIQLKPRQQFYWRIWLKLWWADHNANAAFTCVQSIEAATPEKQQLIFTWLDRRIGKLDDFLSQHND